MVDTQTISRGGTATWEIVVTNTGNQTLTNDPDLEPLDRATLLVDGHQQRQPVGPVTLLVQHPGDADA